MKLNLFILIIASFGLIESVMAFGSLEHEVYRYDGSNNITERSIGERRSHFVYDQNQILRTSDTVGDFNYDAFGRLQSDSERDFAYGYDNRVTGVKHRENAVGLLYNGSGRLVAKQYPQEIRVLAWDGVVPLFDGVNIYTSAQSGSDALLDMVPTIVKSSGNQNPLINDYLGNTLSYGAVGVHRSIYGYGSSLGCFQGQIYDKDLGAFRFAFRHYRPDLMSWTTPDPLGFPDSKNNHKFVSAPTNSFDYLGLLDIDPGQSKNGTGYGGAVSMSHSGYEWFPLYDYYKGYTEKDQVEVMIKKPDATGRWFRFVSGGIVYAGSTTQAHIDSELAAKPNGVDLSYNCHGYAVAQETYWIEPNEISKIVNGPDTGDGWVEWEEPYNGRTISQYGMSWAHSARVTHFETSEPIVPKTEKGKLGATSLTYSGSISDAKENGISAGWSWVKFWEK